MQDEIKPPELPSSEEEQRAFFLGQTARLAWSEIAPFFARGQVVQVSSSIDLIDVALALVADDTEKMRAWMENQQVGVLNTDCAKDWAGGQADLWAVVVNPWVLVQAKAVEPTVH